MAREQIDDLTDVRRLASDYTPPERGRHAAPDIQVGPRQTHGVTGDGAGMDGVEVDVEQLRTAERELAQLHDALMQHLRDAAELSGPLADGSSPVTGPMRTAFSDRADVDGGVQSVLTDYIEEVLGVRAAILDMAASYEGVDSEAMALLNRQVSEIEGEGA